MNGKRGRTRKVDGEELSEMNREKKTASLLWQRRMCGNEDAKDEGEKEEERRRRRADNKQQQQQQQQQQPQLSARRIGELKARFGWPSRKEGDEG